MMKKRETRGYRNADNEEWRDIPGYDGLYQVSSMGRVKSLPKYKCLKERILKEHRDKDGYVSVTLCPNARERKAYRVHRLVAIAFIENINGHPEVDHINTVRDDNRVENLRWVTRSANQLNDITRERLSKRLKGIPLSEERKAKQSRIMKGKRHGVPILLKAVSQRRCPVLMLDLQGNILAAFGSIKEAELVMNIEGKRISDVCNNRRNTTGGFIWRKI